MKIFTIVILAVLSPTVFADEINFSGPYAGLGIGYSSTKDHHNEFSQYNGSFDGYSGKNNSQSMSGSIFAGYNFRRNNIVFGPEISFTKLNSSNESVQDYFGTEDAAYGTKVKVNWNLSLKARLGYVYNENSLFYITGGFVDSDVDRNYYTYNLAQDHFNHKDKGILVGLGIERKVSDNINLRLNYDHISYENETNIPTNSWSGLNDVHTGIKSNNANLAIIYQF